MHIKNASWVHFWYRKSGQWAQSREHDTPSPHFQIRS